MIEPNFSPQDRDGDYLIWHTCGCGRTTRAVVSSLEVYRWRQGRPAQDAFERLDAATREALFISGTCATCWAELFPSSACAECGPDLCEKHYTEAGYL